jgi:hypothetical protein
VPAEEQLRVMVNNHRVKSKLQLLTLGAPVMGRHPRAAIATSDWDQKTDAAEPYRLVSRPRLPHTTPTTACRLARR